MSRKYRKQIGLKMNKLDILLESLVARHAMNLGLRDDLVAQMVKEIKICVAQNYNTRAELISIVKKEIAA